jgi:hypothetical protein
MPFKKGSKDAGAPMGNDNKRKGKPLSDALRKYAAQNPEKVRKIAEGIFAKAMDGDVQAIKEIADRLEGRAVQSIDATIDGEMRFDNKLNIILK